MHAQHLGGHADEKELVIDRSHRDDSRLSAARAVFTRWTPA
jgi:hypothetical protein